MYKKQMYLALVGVGVCLMPALIPLVPRIGAYIEAERVKAQTQLLAQNLKTSEQLKRDRIEERAKTSDALYLAGVMPTTQKLRITNYIDNSRRNPRPDTTIYQDDEIVDVFDSTGRCIGRIESGVWKWKHYYQGLCEGVQNVQPVRRNK
ncbi:hypothetical protein HCG51_35185 (plasmid) [Tolypothrix sp. PCC 7910]|uniref:hypothetical protein n=1 Tax=Tolypothrix sp. PCC 7910 TaxID=2099387 RepID=UPI001427823F|nr:hypothetical protein [Tolypothrix sp. PCC 7910]QIR41922.1 hypothetical protein HCG51_35185 [Tolypothrix sp. PCC 7910]